VMGSDGKTMVRKQLPCALWVELSLIYHCGSFLKSQCMW
jgi:hypothetical protein